MVATKQFAETLNNFVFTVRDAACMHAWELFCLKGYTRTVPINHLNDGPIKCTNLKITQNYTLTE